MLFRGDGGRGRKGGGNKWKIRSITLGEFFINKDLNVGQLFVATVVEVFSPGCPSFFHKRHLRRSVTVQSTKRAVFFLFLPTWVCTR